MVGGWPENGREPDNTIAGVAIDELVAVSGCKLPAFVLALPSLLDLPFSLSRYLSRGRLQTEFFQKKKENTAVKIIGAKVAPPYHLVL